MAPMPKRDWIRRTGILLALLVVGYFGLMFGVTLASRTSDPETVIAAKEKMCDVTVPDGLGPASTSSNWIAGWERVAFESEDGTSYLVLNGGRSQKLRFESTRQDASDRGREAAGGDPDEPVGTETVEATIRDKPAKFLVKTYPTHEAVSGYFQGKRSAIFVEGRFDLEQFTAGVSRRAFDPLLPADRKLSGEPVDTETSPREEQSSVPDVEPAQVSIGDLSADQKEYADELGVSPQTENSLGTQLVLIPPGTFTMGSPVTEYGHQDNETQVEVTISKGFWIGRFEVTQDEWVTVMGSNPSAFSPEGRRASYVSEKDTSRFPVDSLSWFQAIEFCNALSKREGASDFYQLSNVVRDDYGDIESADFAILGGDGYRLPTEAEWEYACRAGTVTAFHLGATGDRSLANIDNGVLGGAPKHERRTRPVGSYGDSMNPWGLFDMHGNVLEFCVDGYREQLLGGRDPVVEQGSLRIGRGGSFQSGVDQCRCAQRFRVDPDFGLSGFGLRVARDAAPSP